MRGSQVIEVMGGPEAGQRRRPAPGAPAQILFDLADERPDGTTEFDGATDRVALPERQLAGHAGCRLDDHPVGRDLEDPPAAGAEDDDISMHPRPELVDHFLIQLTDAPPGRARLTGQEHAEQPPIRDRAARRDREHPGVPPTLHDIGDPVPHDPRLELGKFVGWKGSREHPEDGLQRVTRQGLERRRTGDGGVEIRHGPRFKHGHRDDLLGQDIERVVRQDGRLDRRVVHPTDHDRRLEEIAPELGEDDAAGGLANLVPGAADPLQPGSHAGRQFDEDDQIHGAHVDPELQAARRHQRGKATVLQGLLDLEALLAGDAPVVRPDQVLAGQVVERCARRSARRRLLVNTIVLRWARINSRIRGWIAGQMLVRRSSLQAGPSAEGADALGPALPAVSNSPMRLMSSTGTTTWRSSRLRAPASTIRTARPGPMPPRKRAIVSSGRWVARGQFARTGGCTPRHEGPRVVRATTRGAPRACCRRSRGPRR